MEHQKQGRKFGRETKQRKELLRGLAESLILKGKITTTRAKAKSLKTYFDKLITSAKKNNLSSVRTLNSKISKLAAQKLIKELAPRFLSRNGGYSRIINLPPRLSDGSKMSVMEILDSVASTNTKHGS